MKTGRIPIGKALAVGQGIPHGVAIRIRPVPDKDAPSTVIGPGGTAKSSISPWTGRQIFQLTTPNSERLMYVFSAAVIPFPRSAPGDDRKRIWNAAIALTSASYDKNSPVPPSTGPQPSIFWEVWDEQDDKDGLIPWGDNGLSIDVGGAALVAPGRRFRTLFDNAQTPFVAAGGGLGVSPVIDCGDCQDCLQLYIDQSAGEGTAGDVAKIIESFPVYAIGNSLPATPTPLIVCALDGTGPSGTSALIGQIGRGSNAAALHNGADTSNASPPPFVTVATNNVNTTARVVLIGR